MQKHNAIHAFATAKPGVLRYIHSPMHVFAHGTNDSFKDIFYDEERDGHCFGVPITADSRVELKCPLGWDKGGCRIEQTYSPVSDPFNGMVFYVDVGNNCCKKEVKFVNTRPYLYDRYWRANSPAYLFDRGLKAFPPEINRNNLAAPWSDDIRVAIHLRNGDTVALNNTKRRGFASAFLCLVPVLAHIPRVKVHVVTEMRDEANVVAIRDAFKKNDVEVVIEDALKANEAIRYLAGADVLVINEHSSFGLLAAVLARDAAAVVIASCHKHVDVQMARNRIGRPFVHSKEGLMPVLRHLVIRHGKESKFFKAVKGWQPPRADNFDAATLTWAERYPVMSKHKKKIWNPDTGKLELPAKMGMVWNPETGAFEKLANYSRGSSFVSSATRQDINKITL